MSRAKATHPAAYRSGDRAQGGGTLGELSPAGVECPAVDGVFAAWQWLAISANESLFALLGTRCGGDGVTTFRLAEPRNVAPGGAAQRICTEGVFRARD